MKFKVINGEPLQFHNQNGDLTGTIQISSSGDMIIRPESGSNNIIIGDATTTSTVEFGTVAAPVTLDLLGGGTITSNGNTLNIGSTGDTVRINNAIFTQSLQITGSLRVSGSAYATYFVGDGSGLTNVTSLSASYASTASYALNSVSASFSETASYVNPLQQNVLVTGSLTVTAGVTASLQGTASWSNNAITASYIATAQTASYVLNAVSASFSSTASYLNTLNQDLTFNGNLTLNGTASIAYLNVVYETASVIYSSGSNQFGDAVNDTQTLIGTVRISGSANITGSLNAPSITGSLFGTASFATTASFLNSTTNAFIQGGNSFGATALLGTNDTQNLQFETSGSVRMSISSSGQVGIGTTTPRETLGITGTGMRLEAGAFSEAGTVKMTSFHSTLYLASNLYYSGSTAPEANSYYILDSGSNNRGGNLFYIKTNGAAGASPSSGFFFYTAPTSSGANTLATLTENFRITPGTASFSNNIVGIGTTTPTAKLHVNNTGTVNSFLVEDSTKPDATPFVIDASGNVGIGTISPDAKLEVSATTAMISHFESSFAGVEYIRVERTGGDYIDLGANYAGYGGGLNSSDAIRFSVSGNTLSSPSMYIETNGNVGIGTTNPAGILDVQDTTTTLDTPSGSYYLLTTFAGRVGNDFHHDEYRLRDATGSTWVTSRIHDAISIDTSYKTPGVNTRVWWERDPYDNIQSWGNTTDTYMTINNGNVGIGTTTPTAKLHVNNTGAGNSLLIEDSVNPDSSPFVIDASGNVGIGTTSPSVKLHVSGGPAILRLEGTDHMFQEFYPQSGGTRFGYLGYGFSGSTDLRLFNQPIGGRILFATENLTRMSIQANGNIGVGVSLPTEVNAKFHVNNTSTSASFLVEDSTNPDATSFIIDNSGKVVIGGLSPYLGVAEFTLTGSAGVIAAGQGVADIATIAAISSLSSSYSLIGVDNSTAIGGVGLRSYGSSAADTLFGYAASSSVAVLGFPITNANMFVGTTDSENVVLGAGKELIRLRGAAAIPYVDITGSVIVTGSLTVSGSSTFTNIGPANFTGSLGVTGSANINGHVNITSVTTGSSVANLAIQSDGKIIKADGNAIVDNFYYSISNSVDTRPIFEDSNVTFGWDEMGNDLEFTMNVAPGGSGDMRSLAYIVGGSTQNTAIVSTGVVYDIYTAGVSAGNRLEVFITAENDVTYPAYHVTVYNTGESFHNTIWIQRITRI